MSEYNKERIERIAVIMGRDKFQLSGQFILLLSIFLMETIIKTETVLVKAFGVTPSHRLHNNNHKRSPCCRHRQYSTIALSAVGDDDAIDDSETDNGDSQGGLSPLQLEQLLQNSRSSTNSMQKDDPSNRMRQQATEEEIEAAEQISGNVNVPKTGVSINDEMETIQSKEKFVSQLFPLDIKQERQSDGGGGDFDGGNDSPRIAAIQTVTPNSIGDEPMRYIISIDEHRNYAMVDVPPYSDDLVEQIHQFMKPKSSNESEHEKDDATGTLSSILVTCRDGLHYDETPAVYVTRKSDLLKWKKAFPGIEIVIYRLDTPRDCKEVVTQSLDGYGPWALKSSGENNIRENKSNQSRDVFLETGRPFTRMEWDEETQARVLDNGEVPPDDDEDLDDDDQYTPEAIKKREEDKDVLAIYTPGHTSGHVAYIFPKLRLCCSGWLIPVEDTRSSANIAGLGTAGPALDYRGYITTNSGGIDRQVESARNLVNVYGDRFDAILPSRGPPVTLGHLPLVNRQRVLHDMLNEYAELGRVYNSLGII